MNLLALIPHYRHTGTLPAVIADLRSLGLPVLVVDDGSGADCRPALEAVRKEGVDVSFQGINGGKGAAVKYGLALAAARGYTHVLQIDADGQHDTALLPEFIEAARTRPQAVVCARPVYGSDAPKSRLYGRRITNFWNIVHTGSRAIPDGMIGLRIYPLCPTLDTLRRETVGNRMDFDNEILIRLHWRGQPFIWLDTPVRYAQGGISHFRGWHDNLLISAMHTRLFFGMLRRRLGGSLKGGFMNAPHWSAQNERGHAFFLFCTTLMVRYLPLPLMRAATALVCAYYYAASPQQRRHIRLYQRRLADTHPQSPLPRRFAVYRQFAAFGEAIADRFAVWQRKIRYADLMLDDPDNVYAEMDRPDHPRGQILVCSHLGNTEVCRALLGSGQHRSDFTLNVLVHSRHAEQFNRALKEAGADDLSIIQVSELDTALMLDLAARIERGEWLAIAADRTPVRGGKTVAVDFLGRSAPFPQGPWLLAQLLKAKTNTVFAVKHRGRYLLKLRKFEDIPAPARGARSEAVAKSAQKFADRLAQEAAQHPLQWFNFYDFWNDHHG